MTSLSFTAYGLAVPQGSARAFVQGGRAVVTSANAKLRPWRDTVAWSARDALGVHPERANFPLLGAVGIDVQFWMHRPKGRPKTADVLPVTVPDLDKLLRAIGDSLVNAGAVRDDSQIVTILTTKRYAVGPDLPKIYVEGFHRSEPCAVVAVWEVDDAARPR